MARKKKGMESNLYEGMSYTIKIIPLYKPCRWFKGVWEQGKKYKDTIGQARFTGDVIQEIDGYQLMVMGILDGGEFGCIELFCKKKFNTQKDALHHLQDLDIPETYKPFISRYPMGEMNVNV